MTDKGLVVPSDKGFRTLEKLIDEFAETVALAHGKGTEIAKKITIEAESKGVDNIHLRELLLNGMKKRGVKEKTALNIVAGLGLKNLLYIPPDREHPPVKSSLTRTENVAKVKVAETATLTSDIPHVCCVHVKEKEQEIRELEEDLQKSRQTLQDMTRGRKPSSVNVYSHPSPRS